MLPSSAIVRAWNISEHMGMHGLENSYSAATCSLGIGVAHCCPEKSIFEKCCSVWKPSFHPELVANLTDHRQNSFTIYTAQNQHATSWNLKMYPWKSQSRKQQFSASM